jgi:hypothetical protein
MSPGTVSLYAIAALLGVAPTVLRMTLSRAGVRVGPSERASEEDLARVFGEPAARDLIERATTRRAGGRSKRGDDGAGS